MDINPLVNVTARAWALPVLAAMHDGVIGRQSRLIGATGASRTAFAQSLDHLIQSGLLERNPGHGHPLRPEFRLTKAGEQVAKMASQINAVSPFADHRLLRRTWTLPILATLSEPRHFGMIKEQLGAITDRALAQSLRTMEDQAWISRQVNSTLRPPRPLYRAVNTGREISMIASRHKPVATASYSSHIHV